MTLKGWSSLLKPSECIQEAWRNRKIITFCKGGFVIIVLAGCDVDGGFICATACHSRSTDDVVAWQDSKLYYFLEVEKGLPS
jgi:hypothetical protein